MLTLYIKIGDEDICASFQELSPPRPLRQITIYEKGEALLCDITGWKSEPGPTTAHAQRVTDSGDAQAILIHGGDSGILLKPAHLAEPWNPQSPNQIHRPYMVIGDEQDLRYA